MLFECNERVETKLLIMNVIPPRMGVVSFIYQFFEYTTNVCFICL